VDVAARVATARATSLGNDDVYVVPSARLRVER
jgi:hypothetical protein